MIKRSPSKRVPPGEPPGCASRITVRALPLNTCPTCSTGFTGSTKPARVTATGQPARNHPAAADWASPLSSGSSTRMAAKLRWRASLAVGPCSKSGSCRFNLKAESSHPTDGIRTGVMGWPCPPDASHFSNQHGDTENLRFSLSNLIHGSSKFHLDVLQSQAEIRNG